MTWLTHNWEFVVGTAIAVVGILIGVAIAFWQRQPKQLDYAIKTQIRLIGDRIARAPDAPAFAVTYDGDIDVKDPGVLVVRVANTGKRAVVDTDYTEGIQISANATAFLMAPHLTAKSDGVSPESIGSLYRLFRDSDEGGLTPRLLNPGEWFEVQILTDGDAGDVMLASRFADQTRRMESVVTLKLNSSPAVWATWGLGIGTAIAGLIGLAVYQLAIFALCFVLGSLTVVVISCVQLFPLFTQIRPTRPKRAVKAK